MNIFLVSIIIYFLDSVDGVPTSTTRDMCRSCFKLGVYRKCHNFTEPCGPVPSTSQTELLSTEFWGPVPSTSQTVLSSTGK